MSINKYITTPYNNSNRKYFIYFVYILELYIYIYKQGQDNSFATYNIIDIRLYIGKWKHNR